MVLKLKNIVHKFEEQKGAIESGILPYYQLKYGISKIFEELNFILHFLVIKKIKLRQYMILVIVNRISLSKY